MNASTQPLYADADLYDVIYSWYDDDLAFYVELAKTARGPVLEAACGTGRVLLPALEAGADIDGFDVEPAMIAALQRKAEARGLKPHVAVADMRDFTMPRRYALIVVPFRSFAHLLSTEDQIRALRCLREHLEAGGRLVLNVFHPSFDRIVQTDGVRALERTFPHPAGDGRTVALYARPRYDRVGQILSVDREVIESDAAGAVVATRETGFRLRWSYCAEMELLLRVAGFARWQVAGGFDGRPLEKDTDEMIWTAWRS